MTAPLAMRRLGLSVVPGPLVLACTTASVVVLGLGVPLGWPLWSVVGLVTLLWLPAAAIDLRWVYDHYRWVAFFYILIAAQTGHLLEHVAQMIQLHVLGLPFSQSRGIFGALDLEWVHFWWNTLVLVVVFVLLKRYRSAWMWAGLVIAVWHEIEHVYIMFRFLTEGSGGVGLLADGGVLLGGVPLPRPELHFAYNIVEIGAMYGAFIVVLRRAVDDALLSAFPGVDTAVLSALTDMSQAVSLARGGRLTLDAGRTLLVTRGSADVWCAGSKVGELRPGRCWEADGPVTVMARDRMQALAFDHQAAQRMFTSRGWRYGSTRAPVSAASV